MNRPILLVCTMLTLALAASRSEAEWGVQAYSRCQPWWNIYAMRSKGLTPEEERLQRFWHAYYDSMRTYYQQLDHIDWVAYSKNHGYQITDGNCQGCKNCRRVNYAPVFVSPTMQWAVPNSGTSGPPGPMAGAVVPTPGAKAPEAARSGERTLPGIVPPLHSPGKP
jgi:hypothetical protein